MSRQALVTRRRRWPHHRSSEPNHTFWILAALIAIAACVFTIWTSTTLSWKYDREINSHYSNACEAGNEEELLKHLTLYRDGLVKYELTEGHWVWINPTEAESWVRYQETLSNRINSLQEIVTRQEAGGHVERDTMDNIQDALNVRAVPNLWYSLHPIRFFAEFPVFILALLSAIYLYVRWRDR